MPKFRKKPVEIEAWHFNIERSDEKPGWLMDAINAGAVYYQGGAMPYYTIETLEGRMTVTLEDWIIRGVKGELYPCKPDIFAATYDSVQ